MKQVTQFYKSVCQKAYQFFRRCRWLLLSLLTIALIISGTSIASAQLGLPAVSPVPSGERLPPGVERIGSIETALVEFENQPLFRVAAAAVANRDEPKGKVLVEVRAEQIEANLEQVIAEDPAWDAGDRRSYNTVFDPATLQVEVAKLNGQTVLLATDAYRPQPVDLLTVTNLDARFYRLSIEELAERWESKIEKALKQALERRLPSVVANQAQRAVKMAIAVGCLSLFFFLLQRFVKYRSRLLQEEHTTWITKPTIDDASPNSPFRRLHFFVTLHNQFTLERRRSLVKFLSWLLFWVQVLIWLGGLVWILYLFPETAGLAQALWSKPIALVLIWFGMGLSNRLGDLLITRFSQAWQNSELFTFEDSQRRDLRISTIIRSLRGLKTFTVYVIGVGWALSVLGAPTSSVLTLGAVVALAISLASQSLIKDLVNGFLILTEDQFAIGDIIGIGTVSGLVENMNLRITQIRDTEGRLITIPNSLISQVENLTRSWSRVDMKVTVAYETDIRVALSVIKQVTEQFYEDPEWQVDLLEPPQVLGVEDMSHEGMVIRIWFDTRPLRQWFVAREFRLRLRLAFEEHQIEIGMPQQMLRYEKAIVPSNAIENDAIEDSSTNGNHVDTKKATADSGQSRRSNNHQN
ncbi:mechanosensitive ion channel family protein [Phormidium tenue FACHB-886]|nr:mechanosensitive ion channel family protein [Phormidium tenue FACHB-886]